MKSRIPGYMCIMIIIHIIMLLKSKYGQSGMDLPQMLFADTQVFSHSPNISLVICIFFVFPLTSDNSLHLKFVPLFSQNCSEFLIDWLTHEQLEDSKTIILHHKMYYSNKEFFKELL